MADADVTDDFRDRRAALKRTEDDVACASVEAQKALKSKDIELYKLWNHHLKEANECVTQANERVTQANDRLKEANKRVTEADERLGKFEVKRQRLELVPRSQWFALDFKQIVGVKMITMEEWLEMTYNGNVLNLKMQDEQLSLEETRKGAGFKYFEMDFPVLIRRSEGAKQRVFVRPCYEILFDLLLRNVEDSRQSVTVTGSPGVGKRQFYAYCVFRLSKEPLNGRTLIINCGNRYFSFVNGNFYDLSIDQVNLYQFKSNVVRLIDGRSSKLFGWSGVLILFTSPGCPDYRSFFKASRVEYVMPPWTDKELSIAASVVEVDEDEVQRRYSSFGGIARYVFCA